MTPRQELVKSAQLRLEILRSNWQRRQTNRFGCQLPKPTAHDAIESVVDDCLTCNWNTVGAAILKYYRNASELAIMRLINEVDKTY